MKKLEFEVEYLDSHGEVKMINKKISFLAFLVHKVKVDRMLYGKWDNLIHLIGFRMYRSNIFKEFEKGKFIAPPDPTDKGHVSNVIGKIISDFLAQEISSASLSINYEEAMKMQGYSVASSRPDSLYFERLNLRTLKDAIEAKKLGNIKVIALEAKGFSDKTISNNRMKNIKIQSTKGPISVNYSVASVIYNIYNKVKAKYYDPTLEVAEVEKIIDLIKESWVLYYGKWKKEVEESGNKKVIELEGVEFYCIENVFYDVLIFKNYLDTLTDLQQNTENISQEYTEEVQFKRFRDGRLYIADDGIGVRLKREL